MLVNNKNICTSFFDQNYQTPEFIKDKKKKAQQERRHFLKSAAGMGALAGLPTLSVSAKTQTSQNELLKTLVKTEPWLTLNATLDQLLPSSATGPSASDIRATAYLYQVMNVQPTEQDEKDFILKGVGWLNGYANSEKSADFVQLSFADKEQLLRGISQSTAGQNWLNTLLGYIFQAMLSPASYGGNPDGIGWQWLEHQAGFPLPEKGQRYFELPTRARIDLLSRVAYDKKRVTMNTIKAPHKKSPQGTRKS
jgi:gluconate 2-dehydrogenase gamma chain